MQKQPGWYVDSSGNTAATATVNGLKLHALVDVRATICSLPDIEIMNICE
jgi:hypothetical protein